MFSEAPYISIQGQRERGVKPVTAEEAAEAPPACTVPPPACCALVSTALVTVLHNESEG